MLKKFFFSFLLVSVFALVPLMSSATTPAELNDAVLFMVNDPQQLTFMDMNKLVERNRLYQEERKTLNEEQVKSFFDHMQDYGVINAGTGQNKVEVAYVVQNNGADLNGVIVVKGEFDRNKLLKILRTHYTEHSNEHAANVIKKDTFAGAQKEAAVNPYKELETKIDGHSAHIFQMPLRNREMISVSTDKAVLISSGNRGQRDLLRKTLAVIDGKLPLKEAPANSKVVMTFAATALEKTDMEKRMMARYDKQRTDAITSKKRMKKLGERIRQKVIRNKIEFFCDCLEEMDQGTLTIDRGMGTDMTKTASLVTTFASADRANDVKKRLVKHLVKEIKRNDNVKDKFALGNVSVTTQGNQALIRCQMRDSKEQLHVFNLISSYVTKGLLERL